MSNGNRLLIGQIAFEKGLISQEQLQEVLKEQRRDHKPIGVILVEKGYLTEEQVAEIIDERSRRLNEETDFAGQRRGDSLFGKLLVTNGWATEEQVHDALRFQQEMAEKGRVMRLGHILAERGLLPAEAVEETLKLQNKTPMVCSQCGRWYNVVRYAAEQKYPCKKCGAFLVLPNHKP